MDELIEKYFSIHGRLARAPYFIRGVQLSIVLALISVPSLLLFTSGNDVLWWAGLAIVAVAAIILADGSVSLVVRRLHDLGLSGYHAIWVLPLLAVPGGVREPPLAIPLIVVSLALTFWPGETTPNRFDA
jgi:uncharacterized membrane protein YhaH (DUF805 family)